MEILGPLGALTPESDLAPIRGAIEGLSRESLHLHGAGTMEIHRNIIAQSEAWVCPGSCLMDFAFTQGQEMLRRSARDFLEANCPTSVIRDLENSNLPYSSEMWDRMSSLGWPGLALPQQHGGEGGDIIDQLVLAEEIGRAILPSPLLTSSVTCGQLILQAGSPVPAEQHSSPDWPAVKR